MDGKAFQNGHALEIIKTAIESNAIKLRQIAASHSDAESATESAQLDALYLRELYESLTTD